MTNCFRVKISSLKSRHYNKVLIDDLEYQKIKKKTFVAYKKLRNIIDVEFYKRLNQKQHLCLKNSKSKS